MHYESCPTAVVNAPVDVVWRLLTTPAGWGDFFDVRITRVDPEGPAVAGQRFYGESGPRLLHLKLAFQYLEIDAVRHRLLMDIRFPLGIAVREDLDCVPVDADRCRVNYHCGFCFPPGWRGRVLRRAMGRKLDTGPTDSLSRLKRAAEEAAGF